MTLRCEFVKLSIFPGSVDYHQSNLDRKKNIMPWETAVFFRKVLLSPLGKLVNAREVGGSLIRSSSSELWLGACYRFLHASEGSLLNVVCENTPNE